VIAADINNDESISPADLLSLRKAILGISSEFPNNTSWRFVDGSQVFADVLAPFPVSEVRATGSLTADMMHEDFVATKVGDVDGSINGLLENGLIDSRGATALTLVAQDQTVEAGETVSVTFTSNELEEVYGYQFTMNLKGLELAGVESGALSMTDENVGVLNGAVTVSYGEVLGATAGRAEGLFTMNFVATESGKLSQMISSSSDVTRAEAYVSTSLDMTSNTIKTVGVEIAMREGTEAVAAEYALLQNEPNPFRGATTIGFTLPEASAAQLTVLDVTGKVLMSQKVEGVAGYNTVTINKGDINTSGVLYYQLESGDFTATKKMIIIE